ncbi:MAG: ATP-binding protein [Bacteroidota bacterium]
MSTNSIASTMPEFPLNPQDFLTGGGEMGERMRKMDWTQTPLGPVEAWPQSLKTCVRIILTSRQPMFVWWGKELINLYNDAYKAIVGGKHPQALGQPASEVWREIWDQTGPRAETAIVNNEGTYDEALLLIMERNGYPEETYYTFSYSPVPGDAGGTDGIICANTDDTRRVIGERQLTLLRELATRTADASTPEEVCQLSADSLLSNTADLPFAMIYLLDPSGGFVQLAGTAGIEGGHAAAPLLVKLEEPSVWPFQAVIENGKPCLITELSTIGDQLPTGSWDQPPQQAVAISISPAGSGRAGVLIVGLNRFRLFDEEYQGFIKLVGGQIAASIARAQAFEQERKRAEALAEIDKAKTVFFSNVSHELRTPLTLITGPLEQVLTQDLTLQETSKQQLSIVQRNSVRLLKLVNTLLDFSRLEAGRVQAVFQQTDIASLTTDLSSSFRSAVEQAGIQLHVHCSPMTDAVYVDHTMWERIIFNLLSNAFKFTLQGEITVSIQQVGQRLELRVQDTGCGIPPSEIPYLFSRFHRVAHAKGRTHEGSGIGLAMVAELVKLHSGTIQVDSTLGEGTTFLISIPTGKSHLSANQISEEDAHLVPSLNALPNLLEELNTFNQETSLPKEVASSATNEAKATILLADDNADMRTYISKLLEGKYQVITVKDGLEALSALETALPTLILSDIMMPNLDGLGLLQKVRAAPQTATIPVILISARAGEEATIRGIEAGANDYLVKPFSAKELISRVDASIKLAHKRQETEKYLLNLLAQTPVALSILKGPSFTIELANEKALELWGKSLEEVIQQPSLAVFPELVDQGFESLLNKVFLQGERVVANERELFIIRNGKPETIYINFVQDPLRGEDGKIIGIVGVGVEVTELVKARKMVEAGRRQVELILDSLPQIAWTANSEGINTYLNQQWYAYTGEEENTESRLNWNKRMHPADKIVTHLQWQKNLQTGQIFEIEYRIKGADGQYRWMLGRAVPLRDTEGQITQWVGTCTDIDELKQAQYMQHALTEELAASNQELAAANEEIRFNNQELSLANQQLRRVNVDLDNFIYTASHDLKSPVANLEGLLMAISKILTGRLSSKEQQMMGMMQTSIAQFKNTIAGLVEITRAQNDIEQELEWVSLPAIVAEVKHELQGLIIQTQAHLEESYEVPEIQFARIHVRSIVYNLLSNALKYRSLERALHIRITSYQQGNDTVFCIEDNGLGLSEQQQAKLFTMFKRMHTHVEGSGIGLYIIKRLLENYGNRIELKSEQNVGSQFKVYFKNNKPIG